MKDDQQSTVDFHLFDDLDRTELPVVSELLENCERRLLKDSEHFKLEHSSSDFQALLDSGEINSLFNRELVLLSQNGARTPPAVTSSIFIVGESEHFLVTVALLKNSGSSKRYLYGLPNDSLIANLSETPFRGTLHKTRAEYRNEIFDESMSLVRGDRFELLRNQFAVWHSRAVPDYEIEDSLVILKLNSKLTSPLLWCYNTQSLKPVMSAACTPLPSRFQMAAQCLAEMRHEMDEEQKRIALRNIKNLTNHPLHFVRWTAVQSIYEICEESALPVLQRFASNDPHPEIRESARTAIG